MTGSPFITVRTDVVMQTLVPSLLAAAQERAEGDGLERLESLGWHARAIELERFAPARDVMPWLVEMLAGRASAGDVPVAAAAAVAGDLAAREPAGRPDPGQSPSWLVPGPGGHVRHFVALQAAEACGPLPADAAKRAWMTGFFRHCCEEMLAPYSGPGPL